MGDWNPAEWKPNPCGCRGCNVCGFTGLAPRPKPPVVAPPEPEPTPEPEPVQLALFDEVLP